MPMSEFRRWSIYEQIEPFGARRADIHFGTLTAMTLNAQRGKPTDKVWSWVDFYGAGYGLAPDDSEGQTPEEMLAALES